MNERTQKQAELAALAQRLQLDALHRALQTLEDHLDALESESARQSAELSQLDEKIARLHAEAGLARPPGLARPGTQELADADVPDHPQPSPQETRAVRQRSTDLSCSFAPPDVGEDWDAYLRNVERYIADHGIEVTRDPLAQLLPPHRAAEVRRRFDTEFRPAPWDTWDVVSPKLGLTPNVHRLASLGHDPLLGLVFGVNDILSGSCTFIDKSGAWRVIDHPNHEGTRNPLEALVKVVVHGFSDVFTAQGLPPPFLAPFQLISAKSGFTLKEGGDPVSVRDVTRYMYANGYDLRHFMTTKISPAIAEVILGAYHGARACVADTEPGEAGIPDKLKREQMLALTHGLLASANILKTALYGWNPMAINLAQFRTLARRMLSLAKLAAERDRLVRERLDDGWEALLAEAVLEFGPKRMS